MARLRQLVAGNWKMNGLRADGSALARELVHRAIGARHGAGGRLACDLLVCPPATLVAAVGEVLAGSGIALGGQDCHAAPCGAHTGDISAAMLVDAGCSHVILGHSERRSDHGETDAVVRAKLRAAQGAGLVAVLCVGETEAERGGGQALAVVERQIEGSLPEGADAARLVLAYEPVWAIGSGRTPNAAEIAEVHAQLRAVLRRRLPGGEAVRILYGGSVKGENARELLAIPDVDGALVGGASLDAHAFWTIAHSGPA